jgi:DNA-binding transcriptional MocR family regulator
MTLYQQLAEEFAALIDSGQLAPGERLPSVRALKARRGVSAATVFQAYQQLEARGLVHARPQSGFYVAARPAPPERGKPRPPPQQASDVALGDLVFEVLRAARARGMVPLGSAFPSPALFPLGKLARAGALGLRQLDPRAIVEHLSPGSLRLREQIALRYRLDGIAIDADEIVITNGALEGLNAALQVVTRPGDTVVIESPTFYAALQALERLRLKALPVHTDAVEGIDPDALDRALGRHRVAACWLMPNFQNPLGSLMPEPRKRALVAVLARHGVPLIEDDVYAELYFGSRRPRPAKAFDEAGLVMHGSSFSKCLAPGYRVGWIAAGRHAREVEQLTLMTTLAASLPAQMAVQHFLEQGGFDRHLRALRGTLAAQVNAMAQQLRQHFPEGTRISAPRGGYFLWIELPRRYDATALHAAAQREGIGIAPGALFSPDARYRHCLRLNAGHDRPDIAPALRRLGELLHAQTKG